MFSGDISNKISLFPSRGSSFAGGELTFSMHEANEEAEKGSLILQGFSTPIQQRYIHMQMG